MNEGNVLPKLPDYKDNAELYELEEKSRPDEMAMINTAGDIAIQLLNNLNNSNVLDICCGTGLSMEKFVNHPSISKIVGLDISQEYLDFAKKKYSNLSNPPIFIKGDAIEEDLPDYKWNIIMMASAYHHIENDRKLHFLKRISNLLGKNGYGIIAENILPKYNIDDEKDYSRSVKLFYNEVLKTTKLLNPDTCERALDLIKRVAKYGIDGEYEYKVSLDILLHHIDCSGLTIIKQNKVWPNSGALSKTNAGNYVFLVKNNILCDEK